MTGYITENDLIQFNKLKATFAHGSLLYTTVLGDQKMHFFYKPYSITTLRTRSEYIHFCSCNVNLTYLNINKNLQTSMQISKLLKPLYLV